MVLIAACELGGELAVFGDPKILTRLSLQHLNDAALAVGSRHGHEVRAPLARVECQCRRGAALCPVPIAVRPWRIRRQSMIDIRHPLAL